MRAVYHRGKTKRHLEIFPHVQRAVVYIQRSHTAVHYVSILTHSTTEVAADKTAHVFYVALLLTRHTRVFGGCFGCTLCFATAFQQFRPLPVPITPLFRYAAVGCG